MFLLFVYMHAFIAYSVFYFLASIWHNSQPQVQNGMYPFQRVSNVPGFQPEDMESKNKKKKKSKYYKRNQKSKSKNMETKA